MARRRALLTALKALQHKDPCEAGHPGRLVEAAGAPRGHCWEAEGVALAAQGVLDDVETITAYATEMGHFLNVSELRERRAFIESLVKEIVVVPDNAMVRNTIPMPDDSPIPGGDSEEMALNGPVLSTVKSGGPKGMVDGTIFEMWLDGDQ